MNRMPHSRSLRGRSARTSLDDYQRLLRAFAPLLGASALLGCGNPDLRKDLAGTLCQEGHLTLLNPLEPAAPLDYVALRDSFGAQAPPGLIEEFGERCATGAQACEAILNAPLETGFNLGGQAQIVVDVAVTRGDQAERLTTEQEVLALLGEINTPAEAGLLVYLRAYHLDCDGPNVSQVEQGYLVYGETGSTCGTDGVTGHRILVSGDGSLRDTESAVVRDGNPHCIIGRLPAGLLASDSITHEGVGAFYAEVSHLEAAAVYAFEQLLSELVLHRAPRRLIRQAAQARRDEMRHARITAAIAARYGSRTSSPSVKPYAPRDLESIALDNVREGLMRETFGALIGHHQAKHARDPHIRQAAQRIARDETRHAALSWELHRWLLPKLSPVQRRNVSAAFLSDVASLEAEFCRETQPDVQSLAGMPSRRTSRALYQGLRASLWQS